MVIACSRAAIIYLIANNWTDFSLAKVPTRRTGCVTRTARRTRETRTRRRINCPGRTAGRTWRRWWMPRISSTPKRRNHGTARVPTRVSSATRVITPTRMRIVEWFYSWRGKEPSRISRKSWPLKILYRAARSRRRFPGNFIRHVEEIKTRRARFTFWWVRKNSRLFLGTKFTLLRSWNIPLLLNYCLIRRRYITSVILSHNEVKFSSTKFHSLTDNHDMLKYLSRTKSHSRISIPLYTHRTSNFSPIVLYVAKDMNDLIVDPIFRIQ